MISSRAAVVRDFLRRVIAPNWWRYLVVVAACFAYAFGLSLSGPTWYRAEAILAFKNRQETEHVNITRVLGQPLMAFLEQEPIEKQYDYASLLYSVNMANRVIGEDLEELYVPEDYRGLIDFYAKFLARLGLEYDGEQNTLRLSYVFKDPKTAAEYCNAFAKGMEDFMIEVVERSHVGPILRERLTEAQVEAEDAEAEVRRISELYEVPDLLHSPAEWVTAYGEAMKRSFQTEARLAGVSAMLRETTALRQKRNLLEKPAGAPDTTIVQDIVIAGLRFRLATLKALQHMSEASLPPRSQTRQQLSREIEAITNQLEELFGLGLDVEATALAMLVEQYTVEAFLHEARADAMYERLEKLPRLEAEIRPPIRAANAASATAFTLDKMASLVEIPESYGIHPIQLIDPAMPPDRPIQPAWNILAYVLPTALLLATLWFALTVRMVDEAPLVARRRNYGTTEDSA